MVRLILSESRFHSEPDFTRILSGEEEGAYGWLAVNSEMGDLLRHGQKRHLKALRTSKRSLIYSNLKVISNYIN